MDVFKRLAENAEIFNQITMSLRGGPLHSVVNLYRVDPKEPCTIDAFQEVRRIAKGDYGELLSDMDLSTFEQLGQYASNRNDFFGLVGITHGGYGVIKPASYIFSFGLTQKFLNSGLEKIVDDKYKNRVYELLYEERPVILCDGAWTDPKLRNQGIASKMIAHRFDFYESLHKNGSLTSRPIYILYTDEKEIHLLPKDPYLRYNIRMVASLSTRDRIIMSNKHFSYTNRD